MQVQVKVGSNELSDELSVYKQTEIFVYYNVLL